MNWWFDISKIEKLEPNHQNLISILVKVSFSSYGFASSFIRDSFCPVHWLNQPVARFMYCVIWHYAKLKYMAQQDKPYPSMQCMWDAKWHIFVCTCAWFKVCRVAHKYTTHARVLIEMGLDEIPLGLIYLHNKQI